MGMDTKSALDRGIYTLTDAAQLLGLPPHRARAAWERYRKLARTLGLAWPDFVGAAGDAKTLSFPALIELYVVDQLSSLDATRPKNWKILQALKRWHVPGSNPVPSRSLPKARNNVSITC
jgi:hypothetical protein